MNRSQRRTRNQQSSRRAQSSVLCAYPHRTDHAVPAFHTAMHTLERYDMNHGGHIMKLGDTMEFASGPLVSAARNHLALAFLGHPKHPEWQWMIDPDHVFAPNILERLLEVADPQTAPIVGALCFMGGSSGRVEPTLRRLVSNDPPVYETIWNYPMDSLVEVDATGASCLLVHRSVYETLFANPRYHDSIHPFFQETVIELPPGHPSGRRSLNYGEDVTFCMRARAAGFPIYIHTGIQAPHMKYQLIDHHAYLQFRRDLTEQGGDDEFREWYLGRMGLANTALPNATPTLKIIGDDEGEAVEVQSLEALA